MFLVGAGLARLARHAGRNGLLAVTSPADADTTTAELPRILASIPMSDPDYGAWWNTDDGRWLYDQISTRIGAPLTASILHRYGVSYEPADVANTAFMILRQDLMHAYILRATDPWAYLSQMLKREMLATAGAHFRTELSDDVLFESSIPPVEAAEVSLEDAVELTFGALATTTPDHLQDSLKEAIRYFAALGGARLSHLYTHATSDLELTGLGLVREQILAIANAVLGSRPNNGQTSLVAGFLQDPGFDPRSSILHRRALKKYQSRMATSTTREEALVG